MAAAAAHPSHDLHAAEFGEEGSALRLVLCTACGAHGTTKAVNLAKPCPAQAALAGDRRASFGRQARSAAKGLHPSQPHFVLHGLRPLRLASAWTAGVRARATADKAEDPILPQLRVAWHADLAV